MTFSDNFDESSSKWPSAAFWRLLVALVSVGMLIAVALRFTLPKKFTSVSQVLISADARPRLTGALAALSSTLGAGASGDALANPFFVAGLFTSREVLDSALVKPRPVDGAPTLLQRLLGHPSSGPIDLAAAREELSRAVSTAVDSRTGSIAITISAPSPPVAQRAATLLIEEVDALTQQVRRTQARRRREFVETRVSLAAHALQAAEEDQVAFRRGNASVQAPQLVLEERRRQRAVDMAQDVYVALLRDREEALQEEARNVSSLNVIVAPDLPFKKSSPSGLLLGLASILGMSTLAVLITLLAIRRRTPRDSWPPANAVRLMAAAFRNH